MAKNGTGDYRSKVTGMDRRRPHSSEIRRPLTLDSYHDETHPMRITVPVDPESTFILYVPWSFE